MLALKRATDDRLILLVVSNFIGKASQVLVFPEIVSFLK